MDYPEHEGKREGVGKDPALKADLSKDMVILDMAMRKEDYSIKLYQALFEFVERKDSKDLLRHLIDDEKRHYILLREVMMTGNHAKLGKAAEEESLEMPDYLIKEDLKRSSAPSEIVKLAIRREEESEEFYLGRLPHIHDPELKTLYARLADEEASHRKRLLHGYDDLMDMHFA